MTPRSNTNQLDPDLSCVGRLIQLSWPAAHRLPQHARTRPRAALGKHSGATHGLNVALPRLLTLCLGKRRAHNLVSVPQRLCRQLQLIEAHSLRRHLQLRAGFHAQTRKNGAGEYQSRDFLQSGLGCLAGQRRCVAHIQLQLPEVQLTLPSVSIVTCQLLGRIALAIQQRRPQPQGEVLAVQPHSVCLDFPQAQRVHDALLLFDGHLDDRAAIAQPFHDLYFDVLAHSRQHRDVSLLPRLCGFPQRSSGTKQSVADHQAVLGNLLPHSSRQLLLAFTGGACARRQRRVSPQFHQTHQTQLGKGGSKAPTRRFRQLRQNGRCVHHAELRAVDSHQTVSVKETLRVQCLIRQRRERRVQNLLEQFQRQQLPALGEGRITHLYPVQSAAISRQCAAILKRMVDQPADQLPRRQLRRAPRPRTELRAHLIEHRGRNQSIQHIQKLHILHAVFSTVINNSRIVPYVVEVETSYDLTALRLMRRTAPSLIRPKSRLSRRRSGCSLKERLDVFEIRK